MSITKNLINYLYEEEQIDTNSIAKSIFDSLYDNELDIKKIYDELGRAGVEVILDDRKERPGVKFKDSELIGIPIRITVGRGAADGMIEYKMRREADKVELSVDEGIAKAIETVNAEKDGRHFFNK